MIKKILLLALCFSWIPAMATDSTVEINADGSVAGPGFRSVTAADEALWTEMMTNRATLSPEGQAIYPFGTHKFHSGRTVERMAAGVPYHCAALTPDGETPSIGNTMFASIGVFPRHGYDEKLYPEIMASLTELGVTGDENRGIATFAVFMDPSITAHALATNKSNLFSLVTQLTRRGEKLPEERSVESADVKIRAIPGCMAVLLHPNHPFSLQMIASGILPLRDKTGKDSHFSDIYIDGPVNAAIAAVAKSRTGITTDKEAKEALKASILSGEVTIDGLQPEIASFFGTQGAVLSWRSTFLMSLVPETVAPIERLKDKIALGEEHTADGVNQIAIDVAMRKLTTGNY